MDTPSNWEHKSGYRINNDGCAIKFEHTQRPFVAVIEGILNEHDDALEYYTVIFDESVSPMMIVEGHEIFTQKDVAKNHLKNMMEKHN